MIDLWSSFNTSSSRGKGISHKTETIFAIA